MTMGNKRTVVTVETVNLVNVLDGFLKHLTMKRMKRVFFLVEFSKNCFIKPHKTKKVERDSQ